MRTICYVDGYNLYYGCLKNTTFKWLDLDFLLCRLLNEQSPQSELHLVKYFTADIKANFSRHGHMAHEAQQSYLRALQVRMGNRLEVIKGFYSVSEASMPRLVTPPNKQDTVKVWRLEEKETDVNLALHAYRDAVRHRADQLVLVSNDSDLCPLLNAIQAENLPLTLGVIFPLIKRANGFDRPGNERLSQHADWTRRHIREEELAQAQLPRVVSTKRKPIFKPDHW